MKNILTLISILSFVSLNAQNYQQMNIEAHRDILGYEPEELLEDGSIFTIEGEIAYNTSIFNGLHAYFSNAYPFTAVTSKIGDTNSQYSPDELNAMGSSNIYGIQVDTLANKIMDMNGNLLNSFDNINDFYTKMYQLVDAIVETDIDVMPIGIDEIYQGVQKVRNASLVDNIYPNPSEGEVFIELAENEENIQINIYNVNSRLVKELKLAANACINLDGLPAGVYLMLFELNGKKQLEKIVVK